MSCTAYIGAISPVNGVAELRGKVIDGDTEEELPGTSITIVDAQGRYLGDGVAADNSGLWMLASDLFAGHYVMFTNVGYTSGVFKSEDLYPWSLVAMYKKSATELPPTVVTPDKQTKIPWLLIGAVGVILIANR